MAASHIALCAQKRMAAKTAGAREHSGHNPEQGGHNSKGADMKSMPAGGEATIALTGRRGGSGLGPATEDRHGRMLAWVAGLVIAALLGITAAQIHSLREEALDAAETNIARVDFVLAENLDRTFQTVDLVLADAAHAIALHGVGDRLSGQAGHDWLAARIADLPPVQRLSFSDATGRVIATSQDRVMTATSIADRTYFVALKDHPGSGMVVSEPLQSRADGQWTFLVSRRIEGPDGGFLGAVWAAIDLGYLDRLFAAAAPEADARVHLLRDDLKLLLRHPYLPGVLGQSMADTPTYAGIFGDGRKAGSGRYVSSLDGRDRVVASRRLSRYPFAVTVAVPENTLLTPWRQLSIGIGSAVLAVALGLALLVTAMLRQRRLLRTGEAALQKTDASLCQEQERLASVIEITSDGFWEWHIETGMVDWSERCCAQMGMPAAGGVLHFDDVMGMILPEDRDRYLAAIRRHIDGGAPFSIEIRWRCLDGDTRWMASRGRLIRDAAGRPVRLLGANTDITERKLLESCLTRFGGED